MVHNLLYKQLHTLHHEALRTHFDTVEGEPVQIVEDKVQINVEYEVAYTEDYEPLLNAFIRPFNLEQAPLLRVKAFTLSKGACSKLNGLMNAFNSGS